jgi:hypothetical protein
MSMADRLNNAPDATVVHLGPVTTTLGAARAAHRAREASLSQAAGLGLAAQGKLTTVLAGAALTVGGAKTTTVGGTPTPKPTLAGAALTVGGAKTTTVGGTPTPKPTLKPSVESPSDYASVPADMKAFCKAAAASACAYLPPNQQLWFSSGRGVLIDYDGLVTQSQCTQEGGTWIPGSAPYCTYNYPVWVIVHFTPAANYQFTQSAHCANMFTPTVDDHGAIEITVKGSGLGVATANDATCIVMVTPGA